ncbi:MAG TPA: hypothetical protein VII91_12460 [Bauldia sp.]
MATRITDSMGSRAIGPHMPLDVALAVIPSLPRPILAQLVARAIERLDEMDGDPDLELTGDQNEEDDPAEEDDPDTGVEDSPQGFDPETDLGAEDVGEDCQGGEVDMRPIADPEAYRGHIRRLRCERAYPYPRGSWGRQGQTHRLWIADSDEAAPRFRDDCAP